MSPRQNAARSDVQAAFLREKVDGWVESGENQWPLC